MQRTDAASPLHDNEAGVALPTEAAAVEVAAAAVAAEASAKPTDPIFRAESAAAASPAWAMSLEEMERRLYDPSLVSRYVVNATKAERAKMRQLPPRMAPPWTWTFDDVPPSDASTAKATSPSASREAPAPTSTNVHSTVKGTNQDQSESLPAGTIVLPEVSNRLPNEHVQIDLDRRLAAAAESAALYDEAKGEEEGRSRWSRDDSGATNEPCHSSDATRSVERVKPAKRRRSKDRERRRSRSEK
jgi:hypothetical protein